LKFFTIFNHTLTPEQISDAKVSFGVNEFVSLPKDLQNLWSNIPPELEKLDEYLKPLKAYVQTHISKDDIVLIQGDFGATCKLVSFVKALGTKAVYATTKREVIETYHDKKVVKQSVFKHVRFREYLS